MMTRRILSVIALFITMQALPQELIADEFAVNYPGRGTTGHIAHVATSSVISCVEHYYMIYGEFPADWQDVVDLGLCDVKLFGFQLQPVNPDDPSLDFSSDLYLENSGGHMNLHWQDVHGQTKHIRFQKPKTYANRLEVVIELAELTQVQRIRVNEYLVSDAQLRQLAIVGIMNRGMRLFSEVHGQYPADLDDFLDSGLSPISRNIANPLTGQPFRFDGSPGDLEFSSAGGSAAIWHVDEKGIDIPRLNY